MYITVTVLSFGAWVSCMGWTRPTVVIVGVTRRQCGFFIMLHWRPSHNQSIIVSVRYTRLRPLLCIN